MRPLFGFVQLVDEVAFVVRLKALDGGAARPSLFGDERVDLGQRHAPVDLRLARAEQIEVRAMQHHHMRWHCF